ncbi:MAG TPA: undecaprenyl-diphosphate phosphatase [Dongiaceae bacterium]|jgi:undecaprenyl-diphosphatase|nr:undecaprenyl-diphosphate phosphatase [Dongiaceae bacterium]
MPAWIAIAILGIIEGITEFLPVSSTGHLLLAEHWLPQQSELFNVVIQSGAVIAVIPLFHERFRQFLFQWRERAVQQYALKIFVAFFITGVGGLVLKKMGWKLPETAGPIAWALLVGGVAFLAIEAWLKNKPLRNEITWAMAVAVGFAQLVAAIFPGTSRSGACILIILMLGVNRPLATEFAFIVGIPTMLAAGGYEILKALHHPLPGTPPENWPMVALGFVVSAIVSFITVKWLLRYVQSHTFKAFGWYRIALAAVVFALLCR